MNIEKYGFRMADMPENTNGVPARIIAVYRGLFKIVCADGTGFAHLKTGAYQAGGETIPTTGDFVLVDWQAAGESRILKTLPRKTYFSRLDPSSAGRQEQAMAANFDNVFIMQSLDRDFNPRRLERYLTLAWQSGATPTVLLTKADQMKDCTAHVLAAQKVAIGVDVFALSAKSGMGLDRLKVYLTPGKTVVFLGSSGVGKSTLVNALAGEEIMTTNGIREKDGRGKHTTTSRQLIMLQSGVMVIDTPGMRELGMWDVSSGLGQSFSDVEQYFGHCKFRDCRHQGEPGCAITAAIQQGNLPPERWESYLKLHNEAQYADNKAGYLRGKQQREKEISKLIKTKNMVDYRKLPCTESFACKSCGKLITPEAAGSQHRNHCPDCLSSVHMDNRPGDRASLCKGIMEPVAVWVRKNGEWAVIHRCASCGTLNSNRIAADDDAALLTQIAMKPLRQLEKKKLAVGEQKRNAVGNLAGNKFYICSVCGTKVLQTEKGREHCPQCLSGIHTGADRAALCKGVMEPITVWVRDNDNWMIIRRCRSCGALETTPVAVGDNAALLLSIAAKPLAAPPFPLWQLDKDALDGI